MSRGRPWLRYAAVALPAVPAVQVLPAGAPRGTAYLLVALSGCLAVLVGGRRHTAALAVGPARPGPGAWDLLAAGIGAWVVGAFAHERWGQVQGSPGDLASTLVMQSTFPLVGAGLVRLAAGRTRERRTLDVLDSAILATAVAMLSFALLVEPTWAASSSTGVARVLDLGFPLGNVVMFGALVRLAYAPGAARTASQVGAVVVAGILAVQSVLQARSPGRLPDVEPALEQPVWLAVIVLAGAVCLHPSSRALAAPAPARPERVPTAQVVGLACALLTGPALLAGQRLAGRPDSALTVALFSAALVALVCARVLVMVRQINSQATTDDLTALPNRRALHREAPARLDGSTPTALLLLDLDRFKEVNDSLGHHAGDVLLVQVGERLRRLLGPGDLLARLGGDEFAVLVRADRAGAGAVARRLAAELGAPFRLEGMPVHTGVSIGVALHPEHGRDVGTLLRRADIAMYRAKLAGAPQVYGVSEDDAAGERLRLVEQLRTALAEGQLVLHYQPKVDVRSGRLVGVEALVRWQHPEQGLLLPGAFLPHVERAGLMGALSGTVLTQALDQAAAWRAQGRPVPVAVNLSPVTLADEGLPVRLAAELSARRLLPGDLLVEITEDSLLADRVRARAVLGELRAMGVQISVDDFGTGYSSLAYLRELPVDELKLDRSFVQPMAGDERATALVGSIVALAHSVGLRIVAEGVEDAATLAGLAALGCDVAQGWFVGRPRPADDLLADGLPARGRPVSVPEAGRRASRAGGPAGR